MRIERQSKDLADEERFRARQARTVPLLAQFEAWLDNTVRSVLPKDSLGEAMRYAVKPWIALTKFTAAGYLEASNNFTGRRMRAVAIGRKAFLFVGSARAGYAAAIHCSLVESCKGEFAQPADASDVHPQQRAQQSRAVADAG